MPHGAQDGQDDRLLMKEKLTMFQNLLSLLFRPLRLLMPSESVRRIRIVVLKATHCGHVATIVLFERLRSLFQRDTSRVAQTIGRDTSRQKSALARDWLISARPLGSSALRDCAPQEPDNVNRDRLAPSESTRASPIVASDAGVDAQSAHFAQLSSRIDRLAGLVEDLATRFDAFETRSDRAD